MNNWKKARVFECTIAFCMALAAPFFAARVLPEVEPFTIWAVALSIIVSPIFIPLALLIVVSLQAVNPLSNSQWTRPSWNTCFRDLGDPLHFFHMAAWACFFASLGVLISSPFCGILYFLIGLAGFVGSISVFWGIKLCIRMFPHKFESEQNNQTQPQSIPNDNI
jgi:hypothetical protein